MTQETQQKRTQHYRVTLEDAIAHYQAGDLTAKGLLHFYLKISLKPGWTLKETQKEICEKLGISRAAFYSGLSRLKAEGSINWSTPPNTKFSISLGVCESGQESTNEDKPSMYVDTTSAYIDNSSTNVDEASKIVDKKSPKPPSDNDSGDSPNSYSYSFQLFLNSLSSEDERERFLDFCEKEASKLPEKVVLVESWAGKHKDELWRKFKGQPEDQDSGKYSAAPVVTANDPSEETLGILRQAKADGAIRDFYRQPSSLGGGYVVDTGSGVVTWEEAIAEIF